MLDRDNWPECQRCKSMYLDFIDPDCDCCEGTGQVCPVCLGMGLTASESGKTSPCRCGLMARRSSRSLGHLSILRGRLLSYKLDNFDHERPGVGEAWQALSGWGKAVKAGESAWLTIWSTIKGNGKTHLAAAAANRMNESGRLALVVSVPDFLDYLREAYDDSSESLPTRLRRLQSCDILVLDDLGVEYQKHNGAGITWPQEQMYKLIDYRLRNELPLLVTTNVDPQRLEERIASRLRRHGVVVKVTAQEYRKE